MRLDEKNLLLKNIRKFLENNIFDNDIKILDIEEVGRKNPKIIVYIYKKSKKPITTEDCEMINRLLEDYLDNLEGFPEKYYLEVSSPGLMRLLKKPCDWDYALYKDIEVRLREPINKKYKIIGNLLGWNMDVVILNVASEKGNEKIIIEKNNIKQARLFYNMGMGRK